MITGITSNGYHYSVDERKFADYRFVRLLAKYEKAAEKGEPDELTASVLMVDMIEFIFDEDEMKKIMDYVASQNDGIANAQVIMQMLTDVMKACEKEQKN